ncbi:MAG TPA: hypothetical protein VK162_26645 [Streptosporangiaceae bacterium]|nr:hypothetical protein [Streptosporangiaceae bacterium]
MLRYPDQVPAVTRQRPPGSAYGSVTDLADAGSVAKQRDGRRNRYQIQAHLPLAEPASRERAVGEVLALLAGTSTTADRKPAAAAERSTCRPRRSR